MGSAREERTLGIGPASNRRRVMACGLIARATFTVGYEYGCIIMNDLCIALLGLVSNDTTSLTSVQCQPVSDDTQLLIEILGQATIQTEEPKPRVNITTCIEYSSYYHCGQNNLYHTGPSYSFLNSLATYARPLTVVYTSMPLIPRNPKSIERHVVTALPLFPNY